MKKKVKNEGDRLAEARAAKKIEREMIICPRCGEKHTEEQKVLQEGIKTCPKCFYQYPVKSK